MMHNINLIKIDATDSTNSWMKERYSKKKCSDGDVVWSQVQNIGRGQGNSIWLSEKGKNPIVKLSSHDKQLLGYVAAKIRSFRKPEPYKGKGVKFVGEQIRRKAGKSA